VLKAGSPESPWLLCPTINLQVLGKIDQIEVQKMLCYCRGSISGSCRESPLGGGATRRCGFSSVFFGHLLMRCGEMFIIIIIVIIIYSHKNKKNMQDTEVAF